MTAYQLRHFARTTVKEPTTRILYISYAIAGHRKQEELTQKRAEEGKTIVLTLRSLTEYNAVRNSSQVTMLSFRFGQAAAELTTY